MTQRPVFVYPSLPGRLPKPPDRRLRPMRSTKRFNEPRMKHGTNTDEQTTEGILTNANRHYLQLEMDRETNYFRLAGISVPLSYPCHRCYQWFPSVHSIIREEPRKR